MKYLGIDFGSKKVGFAQSDDDGRVAFPLMVAVNDQHLLKDTLEMVREMRIGCIVIGESVDSHGKPNAIAKDARAFGLKIENTIDVSIKFEKEWYSTVEARSVPGREHDKNVDDKAAAIVLQRYLDRINGPSVGSDEDSTSFDEDDAESYSSKNDPRDSW